MRAVDNKIREHISKMENIDWWSLCLKDADDIPVSHILNRVVLIPMFGRVGVSIRYIQYWNVGLRLEGEITGDD